MSYGHQIEGEAAIAALAGQQQGNVTREQLLGLGLRHDAITSRCRRKRLFRVHLGVFSVGRPPTTPVERASAAVLACGEGAALSHGSALSLWGFVSEWGRELHVSSPKQRRRPGIRTHEVSGLTRADVRIQLGIRVTSPARTFLDCAVDLGPYRLPRMMADARRKGYLHLAQLTDVVDRFHHHPGRIPLIEAVSGLEQPTRSELERAFLAFCARYGLPEPVVNSHPGRRESDMLFAAERVIVELDGWEFHRDKYAFEDDRDRDAELLAAGYVTVRITWERLLSNPAREARRLAAILRRRAPTAPAGGDPPPSGTNRAGWRRSSAAGH